MRWLLALLLLGSCSADVPDKAKPPLHVLTALPLFWGEADISAALQASAPPSQAIVALRKDWTVQPLDVARPDSLASVQTLLIAQPYALQPDELVALDAWVRSGGRALILADPDLRWPSTLSAGDPRRPPLASLLGPLLHHWGLALVPDPPRSGPRQAVIAGQAVNLDGSGVWQVYKAGCRLADPALVMCSLGAGRVALLADADVLQNRTAKAGDDGGFAAIQRLIKEITSQNQDTRTVFERKIATSKSTDSS